MAALAQTTTQAARKVANHIRSGGSDVVQLVGVLLKVVEFVAVVVILDVFVRTRPNAAEVAQGGDRRLTVGIDLAVKNRLQRAGVDVLLWRELGEIAYRGIEINEFAQRVTDAASGDIRSSDDQRYSQTGLVRGALGVHPVVAEQFAVVGGKDDIGIVELAAFFERVEDLADLVVDEFGGGAVLATSLGDLLAREFCGAFFDPLGFANERVADSRGHGRVAVAVTIFGRRVKGIVRADEADEVVPGEVVGHMGDPFGGATADIGVLKVRAVQRRVAAVDTPTSGSASSIVLMKCR